MGVDPSKTNMLPNEKLRAAVVKKVESGSLTWTDITRFVFDGRRSDPTSLKRMLGLKPHSSHGRKYIQHETSEYYVNMICMAIGIAPREIGL